MKKTKNFIQDRTRLEVSEAVLNIDATQVLVVFAILCGYCTISQAPNFLRSKQKQDVIDIHNS